MTKRHLKKLGMTYVDHEWIMAGEQQTIADVDMMEEEVEKET